MRKMREGSLPAGVNMAATLWSRNRRHELIHPGGLAREATLARPSPDRHIHLIAGLYVIQLRLQKRRLRLELLRRGLLRL